MTVLRRQPWRVHHGGSAGMLADGTDTGGLYGQLTACRLDDGTTFYVRENVAYDSFRMSSGARQGVKRGAWVPGQQVLDLAAPPGAWDRCAAAVRAVLDAEGDQRPVRPHRQFTLAWAARQLAARRG